MYLFIYWVFFSGQFCDAAKVANDPHQDLAKFSY
jgi:hypothetical protein